VTKVWEVASTTNSVLALADELVAAGIERVVVESTSDYWRAFVYLFQAAGLTTWLVNARDVKQVPGRPKTDKIDAVWLAKLNERGMLRASFVPPVEIRQLRDYTRLRSDLTQERARHKQRMEKLLEDALIKVSTVATDIFGVSGRSMIEALIAGERDPKILAEMARGKMRRKRNALIEALTGRFDDHHGELARTLLHQVDVLNVDIEALTVSIDKLIANIPAAMPPRPDHHDRELGPNDRGPGPLSALERLDEIPGVGLPAAQVIIAEIGLDMGQFPTAAHLVSWAKLSPRTIQSGPKTRTGKTGKGNPYLRSVLGEAAIGASRTKTFLGERYRRLARRRGKLKAIVAVGRSILVICWHLLNDPNTRFNDLGSDFYDQHIHKDRKTRNLVRQLRELGNEVTLTPKTA
jgi:transposase